jgi:nicotinamidase-related amidase
MTASVALVIIDMQRDFCCAGGYADRAGLDVDRLAAPIPHIARLADRFRIADLTIIYTREGHRNDLSDCSPSKLRRSVLAGAAIGSEGPLGRALVRGQYGHDIVDELAVQPSDIMIDKPGYSAFHATDLDHILRARGVETLVLTGVTTDVCVHSTLRSAIDRGYDCVTISDATACHDHHIQQAMLQLIEGESNIFGRVMNCETLCTTMDDGVFA